MTRQQIIALALRIQREYRALMLKPERTTTQTVTASRLEIALHRLSRRLDEIDNAAADEAVHGG